MCVGVCICALCVRVCVRVSYCMCGSPCACHVIHDDVVATITL